MRQCAARWLVIELSNYQSGTHGDTRFNAIASDNYTHRHSDLTFYSGIIRRLFPYGATDTKYVGWLRNGERNVRVIVHGWMPLESIGRYRFPGLGDNLALFRETSGAIVATLYGDSYFCFP